MKLRTREMRGTTVVELAGEVDLQHSPAVRTCLMELMVARTAVVVVDLDHVTYMDSSGIASLVEAFQMARRNGTRFVLAAISPAVMRVLQLARLDQVFTMADSVESACHG